MSTLLFSPLHQRVSLKNGVRASKLIRDAISRNSTDKRTLIENYDLVSLAIDEICDDGIILEVDPVVVAGRVSRPPPQDVQLKGVDFSEQGLQNLLELGKSKLAERMRAL